MSRHAYKMQAIRNIINMMKRGRNKMLAKGRGIWGGLGRRLGDNYKSIQYSRIEPRKVL